MVFPMTELKIGGGYLSRGFDQFEPALNIGGMTGEVASNAIGGFFDNDEMYSFLLKENGSLPEIRRVLETISNFTEEFPGGKRIGASTYVDGHTFHYAVFLAEIPDSMWNPALAALPLGFFAGLNRRNMSVRGEALPSPDHLFGAVFDISKTVTQRMVAGHDGITAAKSGYVPSHIFGDLATGFFAMLPEISGGIIPERELLTLGVPTSSIIGVMFPDGYNTNPAQTEPYANMVHKGIEQLFSAYPAAREPVNRWFAQMQPLLQAFDLAYQGFVYETLPSSSVPIASRRFEQIQNGATEVQVGEPLVRDVGTTKEPFVFRSKIGHTLMGLMGNRAWRKAIKIPTLLLNDLTYAGAFVTDRLTQATQIIHDSVSEMGGLGDKQCEELLALLDFRAPENIIKYANDTIDPEVKQVLGKQRVNVSAGFRAFDELMGVYRASARLRDGVEAYQQQDSKIEALNNLMRASEVYEPPIVRLAKVWGLWSKLKTQVGVWMKEGGVQPDGVQKTLNNLKDSIAGGERDLREYAKLFYNEPLKKTKLADDIEDVFTFANGSYRSARDMLSEIDGREKEFVVLGSNIFTSGEYSAEAMYFPLVPSAAHPMKVYEPFGNFAARLMINSFKARTSKGIVTTHPRHIALGASLVSGRANGFNVDAGFIETEPTEGTFYTDSYLITAAGRNLDDLPTFKKNGCPMTLSTAFTVLGSLDALTQVLKDGYQKTGKPIWRYKLDAKGMPMYSTSVNNGRLRIDVPMYQLPYEQAARIGAASLFF